jgi:hypothetical protein
MLLKALCLSALVALALAADGNGGDPKNKVAITLKGKQFYNPSGQNWKGKCCDSWSSSRTQCKGYWDWCDYTYKFCIEAYEASTMDADNCKTGWKTVAGSDDAGNDDVNFEHMVWNKERWQGVVVKYQVYDRDGFRGRTLELVDKGAVAITEDMYPGQQDTPKKTDPKDKKKPSWGEMLPLAVTGFRKKEDTGAEMSKFMFDFKVECAENYAGKGCTRVAFPSCSEWKLANPDRQVNGVYQLRDRGDSTAYKGLCEMADDSGKPAGWTVIQKRGSDLTHNAFNKKFSEYEKGFGDVGTQDFWLGLQRMKSITDYYKTSKYNTKATLRIEATDCEGNKEYIEYDDFELGDYPHYTLHVADGSDATDKKPSKKIRGTLGDAINTLQGQKNPANINGQRFYATDNADHQVDQINCAQVYQSGWWYQTCSEANLNGNIVTGCKLTKKEQVLNTAFWAPYRGFFYAIREVKMMVRPMNFLKKFAVAKAKHDKKRAGDEIWIP